jgi:hypothetical protein
MSTVMTTAQSRLPGLLLCAAVMVGASLAVIEVITQSRSSKLSTDVVAEVNGKPVRLVEYSRTLDAVASDKRDALTDADRVFVLRRLIEEELLVQAGLESDQVTHNRRLRSVVVNVMLESILANTASARPREEAVLAYYQSQLLRQKGENPSLESVRGGIEEHLQRLNQDAALEAYIKWLRQQAEVEFVGASEA